MAQETYVIQLHFNPESHTFACRLELTVVDIRRDTVLLPLQHPKVYEGVSADAFDHRFIWTKATTLAVCAEVAKGTRNRIESNLPGGSFSRVRQE